MDYTLKGNQLEKLAETVQPLDSQVERSSDFISVNKNQDRNLNILGKLSSGVRGRERRAKQKTSKSSTHREAVSYSYKEKSNSQGTSDTLVTHKIDGKVVEVEFKDVRQKSQGNSLYPLPSPIPPSQTPQKNKIAVNWSNAENLSDLPSYQDSDSNLLPIKESGEISETKESGESSRSKSSSNSISTNTIEDLTSKLKCNSKSFILPNKIQSEMHDNEDQSSSNSSNSHEESASKGWEAKAARDRAAGMPEGPLKYESYKRIFRTELDACKDKCSISFKNMKILKTSSSSKSEKLYSSPKDALDDGCTPEDIIEAFLKELDSAELVNELKDLGKFDASLRCV